MNIFIEVAIQKLVLLFAEDKECVWSFDRLFQKTIPLEINELFVLN